MGYNRRDMATNFPTSLDNLTNPAGSDPVNNPSHASQHANINDAIEVLEAKVGVNNSAVTTSLDYRVKQLETNPTYTNEMAQDAVAAALAAGTHTNITINYNDTGNSISISAAAGYTNEEAVDAVAAALTAGSGISISYNDPANTITISVDSTIATKSYVDTAITSLGNTASNTYVPQSDVGNIDGVASLDETGKVPDSQIPAGIARDSEVTSAISTEVTNRNSAISTAINNLINSAPGTLDTLGEIATALAADESAAAALTTVVNGKVSKAGGDIIQPSSASTVGLTIKGAVSQTADLQKWLNSSGDLLGRFHPTAGLLVSGVANTGGGAAPFMVFDSTNFSLYTNTASNKGLIIKGAASQTANLQEWQDSSGTTQAYIGANGFINTNNSVRIAGDNLSVYRFQGVSDGNYTMNFPGSGNIQLFSPTDSIGGGSRVLGISNAVTVPTLNPSGGGIIYVESGALKYRGTSNAAQQIVGADGSVSFVTPTAATVGLTVKGAASQTANIQEWQNSSGSVLAKVSATGKITSNVQASSTITTPIVLQNDAYGVGTGTSLVMNYGGLDFVNFESAYATSPGAGGAYLAIKTTHTGVSAPLTKLLIDNNGTVTINGFLAGSQGLIVKGAASQTANLQEWQTGAGTVSVWVTGSGQLETGYFYTNFGGGSYKNNGLVTINPSNNIVPLVIAGAVSQTSSLTEWKNSAGSVVASIAPDGTSTLGSMYITAGTHKIYGPVEVLNNSSGNTNLSLIGFGASSSTNLTIGIKNTDNANNRNWQLTVGGGGYAGQSGNYIGEGGLIFIENNPNDSSQVVRGGFRRGGQLALGGFNTYSASLSVTPLSTSTIGQVIRANASQTANLQEWQNSAGSVVSYIDSAGNTFATSAINVNYINPSSGANTPYFDMGASKSNTITLVQRTASAVGLTVKGAASQTANLQEWQNSAGTVLASINASGDLTVQNFTVNGTTTTVNSTTLTISDKNIEIAKVASPTDTTADGAGITIKGTTDKTFNWVQSTAAFTSSEPISAPAFKSAGTAVSSNITLISGYKYFVDTTAARTLTLPASPSLGDEIVIYDASNSALTNNITVLPNGNKVQGSIQTLIVDSNAAVAYLAYTGSTYGWAVN